MCGAFYLICMDINVLAFVCFVQFSFSHFKGVQDILKHSRLNFLQRLFAKPNARFDASKRM